jgi:hypothetical protein
MLDLDNESDLPILELQSLLFVVVAEDGQFFNAENEDDLVRTERNDARLCKEHVEVEVDGAVHQPRASDLRHALCKPGRVVGHSGLAPLLVQEVVDILDRITADGDVREHLLEGQSVIRQGVVDLEARLFVVKVGKVIEDMVAGVLKEREVFLHVDFDGRGVCRIFGFDEGETGSLNKLRLETSGLEIRNYLPARSKMSILILLCPPLPTLPSPPLMVCLLNGMRYVSSRSEKNVEVSLIAVKLE